MRRREDDDDDNREAEEEKDEKVAWRWMLDVGCRGEMLLAGCDEVPR